MKKYIRFLIILSFILIMVSCSHSENGNNTPSITDSDDFYDKVTLPDELAIDFNLDEIKAIEKAKTFLADYHYFNEEQLIDALITYDVQERNIWREGPQIIATSSDREEVLNIYDGGEAFGEDDGDESGFSYSNKEENEIFDNTAFYMVADLEFSDSNMSNQVFPNSNYAAFSDLDFLPYEQALDDITETLNEAGLSSFQVDETYSLDIETIQKHYEIYLNNYNEIIEKRYENLKWIKDHERYIFSLQQLINDIPIINRGWDLPDGTKTSAFGNPMPTTIINLSYDKEGVRKINVHNTLEPTEELEEVPLISLYDALATLVNDYSLTILEDDVHIISAELCYLSIPKDDQFELIPGWVFRVAKEETTEGDTFFQYKTDIVNAVNGKLYQGRW